MSYTIGVFQDPDFSAMAEYNADDLKQLFQDQGRDFKLLDHAGLEKLDRADCDILLLPYIRGNFSSAALDALMGFHGAGGSLFFLGDLPNKDKWYPLRNMQSSLFHVARCYDDVNISADQPGLCGLTAKGKEILGELEDPEFILEKHFPGLRIVAFPPDQSYALLHIHSRSHTEQASAVMVAERKSRKFLGAKFAMIGFNGGEPRENVDGVYERPWTYNPGLLTREWGGINSMVTKIIDWLEPESVTGAIELPALSREGETLPLTVLLRNPGVQAITLTDLQLVDQENAVAEWPEMVLEPGEIKEISGIEYSRGFGIHNYQLAGVGNGEAIKLAEFTERIFPADAAAHSGFGFATYWAFQTPQVTEEFKHFCRGMLQRGCQYIRVNIPWEDVEPEPGKYDWSIPDQMLEFAGEEDFKLQFWMFPTTRGSGLGESGVPLWSLKEPAIDREGNPGLFPSIWSPFYRQHYFGMIEAFAQRYAEADKLDRFIIDFGNSDFPYGYYYYVNDTTIFDYSEFESQAFARYLKNELGWDLAQVGKLFGREIGSFDEIKAPFVEEKDAWRVYLDFRTWSLHEGISKVHQIVQEHAPKRVPPDLPGHGLGSIADLSAYFYELKAKHWQEERKFDSKYVSGHNVGKTWGGEAWQVGGDFRQYDDALFHSVRLNATYNSIPGADMGSYGDDIAKVGFIRRSIMGATRVQPELAVFDRAGWDDYYCLANLAVRADLPVDLIYDRHRFDFSCYKLLTLPDCDFRDRTVTGGGGGMMVPTDEYWYWLLLESVEKGLNLLVFPHTCEIGITPVQQTFLRQVFGLEDVKYGDWQQRSVEFPDSFGGGSMSGAASEVIADGEVLLQDTDGKPILVQQKKGQGSVQLAGYDTSADSLDPELDFTVLENVGDHTLLKLCQHLDIAPCEFRTGNLFVYKEMVHRGEKDYFLIFSHIEHPVNSKVEVKLRRPADKALDLATGEEFPLTAKADGWYEFAIEVRTRQGRYLSFHD